MPWLVVIGLCVVNFMMSDIGSTLQLVNFMSIFGVAGAGIIELLLKNKRERRDSTKDH